MKNTWHNLVFLVIFWATLAAPASAVPVVASDTTYSVYVGGTESGNDVAGIFRFDGRPEAIPRAGGFLAVNETETEVDPTRSLIIITLSADRDLFPAIDDVALLGIGIFNDGLDLLMPVRLVDARISFLQPGGILVDNTENLVSQVGQANPWDGFFPNDFELVGIEGIGGKNVQTISFQFLVSTELDVPEPDIVLLSGIGLLALVAARRRKRA